MQPVLYTVRATRKDMSFQVVDAVCHGHQGDVGMLPPGAKRVISGDKHAVCRPSTAGGWCPDPLRPPLPFSAMMDEPRHRNSAGIRWPFAFRDMTPTPTKATLKSTTCGSCFLPSRPPCYKQRNSHGRAVPPSSPNCSGKKHAIRLKVNGLRSRAKS